MNPLTRLRQLFQYSLDAYYVFRSVLAGPPKVAAVECPAGYSIRLLHSLEDEAGEALCVLWQAAYEDEGGSGQDRARRDVTRLFADGDICCGLFYGNSLVGMDWIGFSPAIMRMHFSRFIRNEQGAAIGHHTYIVPAHRGSGLQRLTDLVRRKAAQAAGCSAVYVFVGVKNMASLRNMFRSQEQCRLIYHLKVDLPLITLDLFPAVRQEGWQDCRDHLPGGMA